MFLFDKVQVCDSFCGFGGESQGIKSARYEGKSFAEVITAINHDAKAIKCHKANHPHAHHIVEDFRKVFLRSLNNFDEASLRVYWGSAECTHFSIALGGKSRDADSRTLSEDMLRYFDYQIYINQPYHYGIIENVKEFLTWGPLIHKKDIKGNYMYDKKGKPVMAPDPDKKGIYFERWVKEFRSRGYRMEYKILNAADFGVPTNRRRLFLIFALGNMPICWPEPTHGKGLKKQKIVKNCLDLENKGQNIFMRVNRKGLPDPLCENSLKRIYSGLEKHTPNNAYIMKYMSNNPRTGTNRGASLNEPSPTITTQGRLALVSSEPSDISFLTKYYGNGKNNVSINKPAPTLTTKDRLTKIDVQFLAQYNKTSKTHSLDKSAPTLLTKDKLALVTAERFLYNPQWGGQFSSVDKPCFTLIAGMDKMPPYLVTIETGQLAIEVYESDSFWTRKIKEFMAEHGIIAIYMRMLTVDELLKIQGFPVSYKMIGSLTDRKKFIGNAVCPAVAKALIEALWAGLIERYEMKRAA